MKGKVSRAFPGFFTRSVMTDNGKEPPALPDKVKIAVAVFTYDGNMAHEIPDWFHATHTEVLAKHPRVDSVGFQTFEGYPVTRLRNKALHVAQSEGFDYLLMLDNDMVPDVEGRTDPKAVPFFPSALDFAMKTGPCCVGAPYCAAPPRCDCIVMKWEPVAAPHAILPATMTRYSQREAALATGFEEVPALPTGCLLIDMRIMRALVPPYFQYEYATGLEIELAATEDVVFTRNMSFIGIPQFVAWDSWAGHIKKQVIRKPRFVDPRTISKVIRKTLKVQYGVPLDPEE